MRANDDTITRTQAARLAGRSLRWVDNLRQGGFIQTVGRGRIAKADLVTGVVAYYEDQLAKASKSADANKATDARTREIEQRIAMRERQLIPADDCAAVVSDLAGLVLAQLNGLSAQITRDLKLRRKIEKEIGVVIDKIRDSATKSGDALRSGRDPLDKG